MSSPAGACALCELPGHRDDRPDRNRSAGLGAATARQRQPAFAERLKLGQVLAAQALKPAQLAGQVTIYVAALLGQCFGVERIQVWARLGRSRRKPM